MANRFFLRIGKFLFLFLIVGSAMGQQDPQFTQYMFNGMFYNPAMAGRESGYRFSALHRSQWAGYTTSSGQGGAPVTQLLIGEGRLKSKNIGFGFALVNDKIGPTGSLQFNLQTNYHKQLGRSTLSVGISGGMFSSSIDYGDIIVIDPESGLPSGGKENQLALDLGIGALLDRGNYYFGVSSKHLNQPTFDFGDGSFANQLENHSYFLAGYRIRPIGQLRIEPSFLIKSVGFNNFSYDVSVMATHQNRINGGLAFRGEESVSLILGYSLLKDNSLKLGYAFDLVTGGLEAKSPTSHELLLRYTLTPAVRELERVIQRTPRFRF